MKIKIVFSLILVITFISNISAQGLSKKEMKELEKKKGWAKIDSLLKSDRYVIRVNKIITNEGETEYVDASYNFIRVNHDEVVFDVARHTNFRSIDITGKRIEKKIVKNEKRYSFNLDFGVNHFDGARIVNVNVFHDGSLNGMIKFYGTSYMLKIEGDVVSFLNPGVYRE